MTEEEFYVNIPEWISADYEKWTHITLLGYFCHKYEQKHGVRFRLVRSKKGPTAGKEAADFAKLFKTLAPENYQILAPEVKLRVRKEVNLKIYNYINWMFDFKFRRGEKSVTGTQIFLISSLINEFERMYASFLNKQKTKTGIEVLLDWCKKEIPMIFSMHQFERPGDLKMIEKYLELYDLGEETPEYKLINKAKELGVI